MAGLFVTLEGVDGAGKTTQIRLLEQRLRAGGVDMLFTREPGGTPFGLEIRKLLLDGGPPDMPPEVEALLYCADRAYHVREVIVPAIRQGRLVICDRYIDSTLAYQGYGGGVSLELLKSVNRLATGGLMPDLTILFDIPPEMGIERQRGRALDRMEKKGLEFCRRVREGFLMLAREEPERFVVVEASGPPLEVHRRVLAAMEPYLSGGECK